MTIGIESLDHAFPYKVFATGVIDEVVCSGQWGACLSFIAVLADWHIWHQATLKSNLLVFIVKKFTDLSRYLQDLTKNSLADLPVLTLARGDERLPQYKVIAENNISTFPSARDFK